MPAPRPSPTPVDRLATGAGRSLLPLSALAVLACVPVFGAHVALLAAFLLWRLAARFA